MEHMQKTAEDHPFKFSGANRDKVIRKYNRGQDLIDIYDKRFVAKIEKRLSLKDALFAWNDINDENEFTQEVTNYVNTNYEMTQYDMEA